MKSPWVSARVLEASDRSYSAAVLPLLDQSEKEIVVSFYLIEPDETQGPEHPVNRFLESLLRARQRGVRIRLYLNTNFRFRPKTEVGRGSYFERLLEAGVELVALLPNKRLHDKLIIIDGRYVVEGSMNWSIAALESNYESASIIDSPAHALKKLERIERRVAPPLPKEREIDRPFLPVPETVEIPVRLFKKGGLSRMIQTSDRRSLVLYLLLFGQSKAHGKNEFEIDLETVGGVLGFPAGWNRSQIRRQLIKVLRKLAKRYEWIEVEFPYGRDARIRMKKFPGGEVEIPGRLFQPEFLPPGSSASVFLALAREILKKEGVDIDSLSAPELEKRFGISRSAVIDARAEMSKTLSSFSTPPSRGNLSGTPLPDGTH